MRKFKFVNGEIYHICNRGVDKRKIFTNKSDIRRFFQSMNEFNVIDPIGSIYENKFRKNSSLGSSTSKSGKLVNFICYCLNPNHYHFVLEQIEDRGIEKFMQRLGTGYTKYFNEKNKRSGSLFQGKFKATHIDTNEYLLHISAYVNLNNKAHKLNQSSSNLTISSWSEYLKNSKNGFCKKDIILGQFKNNGEYKEFANNSLNGIKERKEIKELIME